MDLPFTLSMTYEQLLTTPLRMRVVLFRSAMEDAAALAVSELVANEVPNGAYIRRAVREFYRRRFLASSDILPMKFLMQAWHAQAQAQRA